MEMTTKAKALDMALPPAPNVAFDSGAQIVDDHGRVPRPLQRSQGVGSDVAGTAGDE